MTTPPRAAEVRWFRAVCGCVWPWRKCESWFRCARFARGEGRTIRCAPIHSSPGFDDHTCLATNTVQPRREMVVAVDRGADRDHGAGRRRDAIDRIRASDRRVE